MALDIFDVNSLDSIVGKLVRNPGLINLADYDIPYYKIEDDCKVRAVVFKSKEGKALREEIKEAINPVIEEAVQFGYNYNLFTALYEAVLNAHQHGNKFSDKTDVKIASKFDNISAEISVIDQGGLISPELILYILSHREIGKNKFLDFYVFSGREKSTPENFGLGTHLMHTYTDRVRYFKSAEGGLVTQLIKYKT